MSMKIPIVVVHGIGQMSDRYKYFVPWEKAKWSGFEPVFYNASWHPWAFNMKDEYTSTGLGFRALSEIDHELRRDIPLMVRLAFYGASKLKALQTYAHKLPFWKRFISKTIDWLAFRLLAVEVIDFVGDVFTYMKWEEYTIDGENAIRREVRRTLENALRDYPDQPVHIVCHSLGTKIIWDILEDMKGVIEPGRIGVLMTMGSPLQPLAIFGWTRPEDNISYIKPKCVDHWLNVYDVRDPIGAPIGSASFRRRGGEYLCYPQVMGMDIMPCANVCTQIGLFPWTAHTAAWRAKRPRKLLMKYLQKYINS